MENFLLRIYSSQVTGHSPLDLPKKAVALAFCVALLTCIILGNLFLLGLQTLNLDKLDKAQINIPESLPEDAVKSLLTPDLHSKVRQNEISPALTHLLSGTTITFKDAQHFLENVNNSDNRQVVEEELLDNKTGERNYRLGVAGKLNRAMLVIPKFESEVPSVVLGGQKMSFKTDRLDMKQLDYAAAVGLIVAFREKLGTNYDSPRRLMQALGDYIQFFTFVLAVWGLLLVAIRLQWCKLQLRLVLDGTLKADADSGQNLWGFLDTPSGQTPLLSQYFKRFADSFVLVRILREAIQLQGKDKPVAADGFVNDRIDLMEAGVAKGEYHLLDWISYAIPNLGFLGTILGIIMSMANVSNILKSSGQLDMVEAFEKVGGALGLAFDTTFVALVWVLVLSYFTARLQKGEADMFEQLRAKAILFLKEYWQPNVKY